MVLDQTDSDEWLEEINSNEAMYVRRWDEIECLKNFNIETIRTMMKKSTLCFIQGLVSLETLLPSTSSEFDSY
jgi:hypothetical protein